LYEGAATILTREMGKDESGDIGMVDKLVDETGASIVNYNNSVGAVSSYVEDQTIREIIYILLAVNLDREQRANHADRADQILQLPRHL